MLWGHLYAAFLNTEGKIQSSQQQVLYALVLEGREKLYVWSSRQTAHDEF